jgi:hypothetical protein
MDDGRPMRAVKASLATSLGEMRKLMTTLTGVLKHRTRWRMRHSQHAWQSRQLLTQNSFRQVSPQFV